VHSVAELNLNWLFKFPYRLDVSKEQDAIHLVLCQTIVDNNTMVCNKSGVVSVKNKTKLMSGVFEA